MSKPVSSNPEAAASAEFPEEALERFMSEERLSRLDSVLAARTSNLTIVLDDVRNQRNISAVMRSADAFGVRTIHLIGSDFEYSRGVSLGTEQWIDFVRHDSPEAARDALLAEKFSLVVTAPENDPRIPKDSKARSLPVYELPFSERLALVFGNERGGINDALFRSAAYYAYIPMLGFVESLNISVACAITLYSSMIEVRSGTRQVTTLDETESRELRAKWLKRGVQHADAILREISKRGEE